MNRYNIIQGIINKINAQTYIEIGVHTGEIFFQINAKTKIAVDPEFKFSFKDKLKQWQLYNRIFSSNKNQQFFETTSDDFFLNHAAVLDKGIDVAFVDGFHTYHQSYADVKNCLKHLNKNGFILIHDCNPPTEASGTPIQKSVSEVISLARSGSISGWTGHWCGDVWKVIARLRSEENDLNIFTLDMDWGIGIVHRGSPENLLTYSPQQIEQLGYSDFDSDRKKILNLKAPAYFLEFQNSAYASR
jgi:hypothetical protein